MPSAQPQPTVAPTSAPATPTPTPARTSPPATASPAAAPTPTPTPTAVASCPDQQGGTANSVTQLVAVRIAHHPGFDRIVFELGPSGPPAEYRMPEWRLSVATSFTDTAGRDVQIDGNAWLGLNFQGNSIVDANTGQVTYTGPTELRPGTPLVRHVRLIEDFERVQVWGIGLERLACASVLELTDPVRLVLDLPTPP